MGFGFFSKIMQQEQKFFWESVNAMGGICLKSHQNARLPYRWPHTVSHVSDFAFTAGSAAAQ